MFEAMIDPTGGPSATATGPRLAARPDRLDGLVVGLVANPKKNAEPFLDAVGELLAAEQGTADVVRTRKTSITDPIPPATLDELVQRCDVVLIGVGDCGSCSADPEQILIVVAGARNAAMSMVVRPFGFGGWSRTAHPIRRAGGLTT